MDALPLYPQFCRRRLDTRSGAAIFCGSSKARATPSIVRVPPSAKRRQAKRNAPQIQRNRCKHRALCVEVWNATEG
jgi:hypothetical protein